MNNRNKEAMRLLDRLYKDLYLSESVLHHGSGNKYDKFNNIKAYIDKLEDIHTRVSETGRHVDYLKQLYHDKYVIKREDIPESYYEHQNELYLERGYGHVQVDEEQLQEEVINNQKARLDVWLDYFLSEDAKVYPFWAKYWAFQGMLKLGAYDKEKGQFHRRTKNTVEPFADLNREALAMSIDVIEKMLNKEEINDSELEILVKTGSFQKIYSHILTKVLKENGNITKRNIGKWVKYDRGSDHIPLVESLQGYNTGWCTAGESTAKTQLECGDFYVYYTLDENNEYKVPRIAIRMEGSNIGEIRGIAKDQNIESEMEQVVEQKIKDFPRKDIYYKRINDMKKLTLIYKKHKTKEKLTQEELRFLYEIDDQIIGFGYEEDPRIQEIIDERGNQRKDFAFIFDCNEKQIAFDQDEINEHTVYCDDDYYLNVTEDENVQNLVLPKFVKGYFLLYGLTKANGLVLPEHVGVSLRMPHLELAENIVFPKTVWYNIDLSGLKSAENLVFPQKISGSLYLENLISAENVVLPQSIGGGLDLNSLKSANRLVLPKKIGTYLRLDGLEVAYGLEFPKKIWGTLYLDGIIDAKGLVLPQCIYGSLNLNSLINVNGLVLPQKVGGSVFLTCVENVEGLVIPDNLTYTIYCKGFNITPENVEQYRNNKKHV